MDLLQSEREFAVEFNSAFGGYFIISFFIFVKLYLELQFGSFISMKGGSKIDGSHLEPIADRDYMARGNKFTNEKFSKNEEYSEVIKNHL